MNYLAASARLVVQYFQGAYQEFRRVTWPNREQIVQYTILVLITIVVAAAILTAFDYVLQQISTRYLIR